MTVENKTEVQGKQQRLPSRIKRKEARAIQLKSEKNEIKAANAQHRSEVAGTYGEALHRAARVSPRKAALLANMLRGKSVSEAVALLKAERRAGSVAFCKIIESAQAQMSLSVGVIRELRISQGPMRQMYMPRAKGSASPIQKKTSHIYVRVETK